MKTCLAIAVLIFFAIVLAVFFEPRVVRSITVIGISCFGIMFGWYLGLVDVQRNGDKEEA